MTIEIKGFVPNSLVDWDGNVASVIFLAGCTFRCGYCSNKELVTGCESLKSIGFEEVEKYILANRDFVDGVVITGGEPTIHADFPELCRKIKKLGFKVKIDTNGTNPEMLGKLLGEGLVDYVAMDIKTWFEKYREITNVEFDTEKIKKSIEIVKEFPEYEFRITMFPKISKEDLIKIAQYLRERRANKKFFIHQFRNEHCLDSEMEKIKPYKREELEGFLEEIKSFFDECRVRNA